MAGLDLEGFSRFWISTQIFAVIIGLVITVSLSINTWAYVKIIRITKRYRTLIENVSSRFQTSCSSRDIAICVKTVIRPWQHSL